jgi:hypothetical protein
MGCIAVDIRQATDMDQVTAIQDMARIHGAQVSPVVYESVSTVTLADGKTVGQESLVSWEYEIRRTMYAYCLSVVKEGKTITVMSGIEPVKSDLCKEIVRTLILK